MLEIGRHHVELVKVGEQRAVALRHDSPRFVPSKKTGAGLRSAFFVPGPAEPGSAANAILDSNTTTAIDLDQGQSRRCRRILLSFAVPRDRYAEAVGSELFISRFDS